MLKFTSTIHEIRRNLTILGEPKETIDSLSVCRKQSASVVFFFTFTPKQKTSRPNNRE